MVEPVFAHLEVNQGRRRFRRRGLAKVRLEFMLHLAACNRSRAVALTGAPVAAIGRAPDGLMHRRRFPPGFATAAPTPYPRVSPPIWQPGGRFWIAKSV